MGLLSWRGIAKRKRKRKWNGRTDGREGGRGETEGGRGVVARC
jgi:hypothetical protein